MDAQDIRNLQEAYMDVYQELDEVLDTPQKSYSYAKKMLPSALRAFVTGDKETLEKRSKGAKMGLRKIEKRNQKEEFDIYDIILSHLLDEGYAETPEQAEVIMVNMSEDWRESICEGMKPLPVEKMDTKAKELKSKFRKSKVGTPEASKLLSRLGHIVAANAPTGPKIKVKEQVDLYDVILSHLLDEGYAETQEQAEVIMVNMSEGWRESICEEYKKLPVGKMIKQAAYKTYYGSQSADEEPVKVDKQVAKMGKVADDHNPAKAKRKEEDNRRIGGRKRDAGRPRSNELQDNW